MSGRLNLVPILHWFGTYSSIKVIKCESQPKIYHLFVYVIRHTHQYPYWLGLKKRDFCHLFHRLLDDLMPALCHYSSSAFYCTVLYCAIALALHWHCIGIAFFWHSIHTLSSNSAQTQLILNSYRFYKSSIPVKSVQTLTAFQTHSFSAIQRNLENGINEWLIPLIPYLTIAFKTSIYKTQISIRLSPLSVLTSDLSIYFFHSIRY